MRILLRIAAVLALLYLTMTAALALAMRQPPGVFGAIMSKMPPLAFMILPFESLWMNARAGNLHTGELAPDFTLNPVEGGSPVRLSSLRGKMPVVLIFGSYT
jgi:hypothetical protein